MILKKYAILYGIKIITLPPTALACILQCSLSFKLLECKGLTSSFKQFLWSLLHFLFESLTWSMCFKASLNTVSIAATRAKACFCFQSWSCHSLADRSNWQARSLSRIRKSGLKAVTPIHCDRDCETQTVCWPHPTWQLPQASSGEAEESCQVDAGLSCHRVLWSVHCRALFCLGLLFWNKVAS